MAKVVDGNFGKYPTGLKHTDVLTRPLTLLTEFSRGKTRSLTLPGVTYTVCCHKGRPSNWILPTRISTYMDYDLTWILQQLLELELSYRILT